MADAEALCLSARLPHIKGMLGVLQAIKQTKNQMATLHADQHGVVIFTYDDSRVMQACANFRKELFTEYVFTPQDASLRKSFSTSLSSLVDSLAVCAAADGLSDLLLKWPDPHGRLLLQVDAVRDAAADGGVVDSCMYAEISCEACNFAEDLEGEMTQPRSQFTLPCSTLRELVDDMDWAGAAVCIAMRSEPPALSFTANGPIVGDLKVDVDASRASGVLHSFECIGSRVSHRYKFKFLRTATCMPPALMGTDGDGSGVSKLQLDSQGMLKVLHLLHIARKRDAGAGGGGSGFGNGTARGFGGTVEMLTDPPASFPGSYAGGAGGAQQGSAMVPVTFVLFPEDAGDDDAAADEADGGDDGGGGDGGSPPPFGASPELDDAARR